MAAVLRVRGSPAVVAGAFAWPSAGGTGSRGIATSCCESSPRAASAGACPWFLVTPRGFDPELTEDFVTTG